MINTSPAKEKLRARIVNFLVFEVRCVPFKKKKSNSELTINGFAILCKPLRTLIVDEKSSTITMTKKRAVKPFSDALSFIFSYFFSNVSIHP